jgi:hypothetical protein
MMSCSSTVFSNCCSCGTNVCVKICSFGDSASDDDWERTTVDRLLLFVGDGNCFGISPWISVVVDGINIVSGTVVIWCSPSSWNICVQRINEARFIEGSTIDIVLIYRKK